MGHLDRDIHPKGCVNSSSYIANGIEMRKIEDISLKNATADDFGYFYTLRKLTMTEHFIAAGKEWNDEEIDRHKKKFDINTLKIIFADGRRVGFIKLMPIPLSIEVSHFCLEPAMQGRGIGAHVMMKVLEIAQVQDLRVVLNVLIGNQASRFYERLGFARTSGDDPLLKYYVWEPL